MAKVDSDSSVTVPDLAVLAMLVPGLTTAVVLPLVPWYLDMPSTHVLASLLHVLACVLGATMAVFRGLRPCLLVASTFPLCWLSIPAAYQIARTQAAWGDAGVTLDASATLRAQAVLIVGQLALLLFYAVGSMRRERASRSAPLIGSGRRTALLLAVSMLAMTALLVPLVISAAGGVGALFSSREGFNQALVDNGFTDYASPTAALVKLVPAAFATVSTVLGLHLWRTRASGSALERRWALGVCLAGLGLLCIVANPFAFSRFVFLICFGPVVMVLLRPRSRKAAVAWLGGTLFAFLLAYPAADLLRLEENTNAEVTARILASKDYDGFQQAINTVTYVDAEGISWGHHVLSAGLFFVPRELWSDKAVPASLTVAEARGYTFTNLSIPAPAEAYLNGGWPGVALLMGLLGLAMALLDRAWRADTPWSLVAAYLAMAQVGIWRGPLGSAMPVFGFALGVLIASLLLSRARSRAGGTVQATEDMSDEVRSRKLSAV